MEANSAVVTMSQHERKNSQRNLFLGVGDYFRWEIYRSRSVI
jgi:hypothetical protein